MLLTVIRAVLLAVILTPGFARAQEIAGRFLVAAGDVSIDRAGTRLPARAGTEVRTGDTLVLGPQSNAQLRLTDESMISLRPETTFRLTEYAFQGRSPEQQRATFNLVQGAIRTVTGAIGRLRQENYGVVTPTSTIGIRGTHYAIAHRDSFQNPDGSRLPGGTYGAVTDGRISVTNQAGTSVFGADQYFRVESPTASPTQLLAPPTMLSQAVTRNAARATTASGTQNQSSSSSSQSSSSSSSGGSSETSTTVAQTGLGGSTGGMGLADSVASPAPLVIPETTLVNSFISNQTATATGVPATVTAGLTGTTFFRATGPFSIPVSCAGSSCSSIVSGEFTLGVNFTLGQAGFNASFKTSGGETFNLGSPFNANIPITISGGTATINSTVKLADFSTQSGAFRCSSCSASNGVGFVQSWGISGTISGGTANLVFTAVDASGTNTFSIGLSQQTPPNNLAGATVIPTSAGGSQARSAAYWQVTADASQRLTAFGPSVGALSASVGSATNTISGSNASAGNLVWGTWGAGASVTDVNYVSFTTNSLQVMPWITGTPTNTLPTSLGTVTYSPIGWIVNAGTGTLNSGSITADFANQSMSINLNATNTTAGNAFQMNGTSGFSSINGRFSAAFSTVTCSGPCTGGAPSGSFGGFFAGAGAEGAGVAFSAGNGSGNGVTGVAAFKR